MEQQSNKAKGLIETLFEEFYSAAEEAGMLSVHDLYLRIVPAAGELSISDEEESLTVSKVIFSWIVEDEREVEARLREMKEDIKEAFKLLCDKQYFDRPLFLPPLSVLLEDPLSSSMEELLLIDDLWVSLNDPLMKDLDRDLQDFFGKLMSNYSEE